MKRTLFLKTAQPQLIVYKHNVRIEKSLVECIKKLQQLTSLNLYKFLKNLRLSNELNILKKCRLSVEIIPQGKTALKRVRIIPEINQQKFRFALLNIELEEQEGSVICRATTEIDCRIFLEIINTTPTKQQAENTPETIPISNNYQLKITDVPEKGLENKTLKKDSIYVFQGVHGHEQLEVGEFHIRAGGYGLILKKDSAWTNRSVKIDLGKYKNLWLLLKNKPLNQSTLINQKIMANIIDCMQIKPKLSSHLFLATKLLMFAATLEHNKAHTTNILKYIRKIEATKLGCKNEIAYFSKRINDEKALNPILQITGIRIYSINSNELPHVVIGDANIDNAHSLIYFLSVNTHKMSILVRYRKNGDLLDIKMLHFNFYTKIAEQYRSEVNKAIRQEISNENRPLNELNPDSIFDNLYNLFVHNSPTLAENIHLKTIFYHLYKNNLINFPSHISFLVWGSAKQKIKTFNPKPRPDKLLQSLLLDRIQWFVKTYGLDHLVKKIYFVNQNRLLSAQSFEFLTFELRNPKKSYKLYPGK